MTHEYQYLSAESLSCVGFDQPPDAYGTLYAYYPATGEEIIVQPSEPTTEVGRELVRELLNQGTEHA